MFIQKRRIYAEDEIPMETPEVDEADEAGVEVAPEATDLLFEAEDVAEIIAEVTGETVEVTADGDTATFAVGNEEFTVEAEGDEEIVEARKKEIRGKKAVKASTKRTVSKHSKVIRKNFK